MRFITKAIAGLTLCGAIAGSLQAAAAAPVQITFWHNYHGDAKEAAVQQLIDAFNAAHSDIHVTAKYEQLTTSLSQMSSKISVAIAGDAGPDVMIFNRPYVAEWAAAGAFVPLDSFLGPLHLSRSDYFPFTWDEGTYRGHVYVLPVDTDSRGMSYNKALFANAGLDPDNPPVQLAAVDDAAKKLTIPDAGGKYKQIGLIPWNHQGVYLFTWTPSFGGSLYDEATGKLTVNDPHNVHVLDWFHSYAAEYGYPLGGVNFPGGNLAMEIDGNQYVESTHASHPEMQIGVAPMPYPDGGRPDTTYAGGFGIAVLSGSKHPKEAATFAAYWVSAQTELTLAKATGSFPAVISAARDPFFRSDPYHDTFLMMLPRAIARPPVPILGTLWDELKATTNRVLKNNEVPQAVLDDVQTRMEALLEQTANGAH